MKKSSLFFLLSFVFILALIYLVISNEDSWRQSLVCGEQKEVVNDSINGLVLDKYLDKSNHNLRTVKLDNRVLVLALDTSGLFSYILRGDQLSKRKGSDSIIVFRGNLKRQFKLFFDCH